MKTIFIKIPYFKNSHNNYIIVVVLISLTPNRKQPLLLQVLILTYIPDIFVFHASLII